MKRRKKEELEEELRKNKKRKKTERAGLYQISDQSVHKRLREMHSK
jgi:hypothetical protein